MLPEADRALRDEQNVNKNKDMKPSMEILTVKSTVFNPSCTL